eukprot:g11441.t1
MSDLEEEELEEELEEEISDAESMPELEMPAKKEAAVNVKPKIETVQLQNDVAGDKKAEQPKKADAKETVESDLENMSTDEEEEPLEEEEEEEIDDEELIAMIREAKKRGLPIDPAMLANYEEALRRTGEDDLNAAPEPPTKKQKQDKAAAQQQKNGQKQTNIKVNRK